MDKKSIFICYCQKDREWRDKIAEFLEVLKSYAAIDWWADTRIEPGTKWEEEIEQALNHATAALLLVSTPFLNSTFIREKEIPILLQRFEKQGVILIPILVSKCNWEIVPWLKPIQFFNHTDGPLQAMDDAQISNYLTELNRKILDLLQGKPIEKTGGDKKSQGDGAKTTLLTKCPPAHIDLIGRETELRELETLLSENKAVVLVNGMGGIGKTEVCRTFFHKYHGGFAYAGWVDYHSSLKESFVSAIYEDILGENLGENMEERFKIIIRFLQSQPGQVFLVVDNIDNEGDPDLLELTALRSPVLLNSRQRLEGFQSYSLDVLDMKGCKGLFYRYYEIERNEEMVEGLIGRCGNHTLTVELLARVGQQAGIKLEELLVNLGQEGLSLGEVGEESVRTFWHSQAGEKKLLEHLRVVFDLSKIGEEEMGILLNLSILPALYIDQENIKKWLGLKSGGVIERLVKGGWLRRRGGEIFMHQVVQEVVRSKEQPTLAKCGNLVEALVDLLHVEPGENPLSKKVWLVYGEVVLGHLVEEEESLATLANNLSMIYKDMGDLSMALSFQEQSLAIKEKTLGKDHPDLAISYNNLSLIYQDMGDLSMALSYQEQSLAIREKTLGKDHPDLASSYNNISLIYQDLGDLSMALSYQEQSLAIFEKTLGKDHPSLATSYHNLSTIYLELKNYQQALFFSRQAVNILQNLFPNGHPNLDIMKRNLEKIEKEAAAAGEKE